MLLWAKGFWRIRGVPARSRGSNLFWAAFAALLTLAGCGKSSDLPIIASGGEYTEVLERAQKLSSRPLERFEGGEKLLAEDQKNLREALRLFDGLIAFSPNNFGPYFGAAKIHDALGEPEKAFANMQKFIELGPPRPRPEVKRLLAEAHYFVGKAFEDRSEFELAKRNAERAVGYYRSNPDYLALLASCYLRSQKATEAHLLVDEALKLDPANSRAKQLHNLFKSH